MEPESRSILFRVVLDVVCLAIVGFPILIFYFAGTPFERGFFCDDESLRHPFKDSTVPSWTLYTFGLIIPTTCIAVTEFLLAKWSGHEKAIKFQSFTIPMWIVDSYRHIGVFGFGAVSSQLLTDIAKYSIGRLRPHFISVCNPDVDCTNPQLQNVYITQFNCRGTNKRWLKDMRLSFPSGHSSFSMYASIYLAVYIHAKFTWRGSKLVKHVLQFMVVALSYYTCLSRISDYKHHWSDVLSGGVLGISVAVLIVVFVSDLFPRKRHPGIIVAEPPEPSPVAKREVANGQNNSVI